ncbi:MAG: ATP-binding cassette domain-containing protein [Flavobacteriales bacterium]|nr:ATP-binding cassette domain-containing protein [Flavobacteriales bacterium]
MSEDILRSLMQLFAVIAKQDDGLTEKERSYVRGFLEQELPQEMVEEYFQMFENLAADEAEGADGKPKKRKLTSVGDSVRTIGICKQINSVLTQKQKVIVLVRLFEFVSSDRNFSEQRMAIIDMVAGVFNISNEEFKLIQSFITHDEPSQLNEHFLLIIGYNRNQPGKQVKFINYEPLRNASLIILKVPSINLYFLRFIGFEDVRLNDMTLRNDRIYLFANSSTIRSSNSRPIYFNDVTSRFLEGFTSIKLSYAVDHVNFRFPNGKIGLHDINLTEGPGKLVAIMGSSGAGKTTLLNVLSGIEKPSSGEVRINGINIHHESKRIEGVIGLVPQDNLLIEELTVYQNLYFNAQLCFRDLTRKEIRKKVDNVLENLGLTAVKDLIVGNELNKVISGGQRKRLNIGLELIREPSVLFLDEPTSGLSSLDSENVMDLLRELTLKGKLIFVVIHQPSSEIYKMLDKILFIDKGGHLIYYGNPVEAVSYFKEQDHQINVKPDLSTIRPDEIFSIVESRVVNEYGELTDQRKITPEEWESRFRAKVEPEPITEVDENPPKEFYVPAKLKQALIFLKRDLFSKLSNRQYLLITMLEAPLLALFLSFIVTYIDNPDTSQYIYRNNENIPAYIFMTVIVSLFVGLIVSAEELFKDRKILQREKFLHLSRSSYLLSKIMILFSISALQALMFVWIGNSIIGIKGMFWEYWLMVFTLSSLANLLGLNLSSAMNSAVAIYVIIPLLIIPQMILGGAMFSFENLNRAIGGGYRVPLIAQFMPARWGYEGLVVNQFVNNRYQKLFYEVEKKESQFDFKQSYFVTEITRILDQSEKQINEGIADQQTQSLLNVARNEINLEVISNPKLKAVDLSGLDIDNYKPASFETARSTLEKISAEYTLAYNSQIMRKELILSNLSANTEKDSLLKKLRDDYYNDYLADVVKKRFAKYKVVIRNERLLQVNDPIYRDARAETGYFSVSSPFFTPKKHLFGTLTDTFYFNLVALWALTLFLYITLYYEWLRRLVQFFEGFRMGQRSPVLPKTTRTSVAGTSANPETEAGKHE